MAQSIGPAATVTRRSVLVGEGEAPWAVTTPLGPAAHTH